MRQATIHTIDVLHVKHSQTHHFLCRLVLWSNLRLTLCSGVLEHNVNCSVQTNCVRVIGLMLKHACSSDVIGHVAKLRNTAVT